MIKSIKQKLMKKDDWINDILEKKIIIIEFYYYCTYIIYIRIYNGPSISKN